MLCIREIGAEAASELYDRMERDFPPNERPPRQGVWLNMKRGVYLASYLMEDDEAAGYAVISPGSEPEFSLLSYFAIEPGKRGEGLGSRFLELLIEKRKGCDILIEVEDPGKAVGEERRKRESRIRFYANAGFRMAPVAKCSVFGVDMLIMHYGERAIESVRQVMHGIYIRQFVFKAALKAIAVED
jgi:GNAT superfamily N-acetyltransferase